MIISKNKQECEIENESAIRKGIVAANNLDKGHIISRDDLMFARPASEFLSSEISKVIGKKLNKISLVWEFNLPIRYKLSIENLKNVT